MPIQINNKGTHIELVLSGTGASMLTIREAGSNTESGGLYLQAEGKPGLKAGGTSVQYFEGVVGSGNTAMYLYTNQGGTSTMKLISMGAHDSAGSGYRVLRVSQTP